MLREASKKRVSIRDTILYYVVRFQPFSTQELPKLDADSVSLVTLSGFLLLIYPVLLDPM